MKKCLRFLLLITLLLYVFPVAAQRTVPLMNLDRVSGELLNHQDKTSIGDKVVSYWLGKGYDNRGHKQAFSVYHLESRFSRFICDVGIVDDLRNKLKDKTLGFKIWLDGKEVTSGTLNQDKLLIPVELDVRGKSSLCLQLIPPSDNWKAYGDLEMVAFGEPQLTKDTSRSLPSRTEANIFQTLQRVSGELGYEQRKSSLCRIVVSSYLTGNADLSFCVYEVPLRYSTFSCVLGLQDDEKEERSSRAKKPCIYRIKVNGKEVLAGEADIESGLIPINIDVHGARSLRLELENGQGFVFGDPKFLIGPRLTQPVKVPVPVPPSVTNPVVASLTSPNDGARASGASVELRWQGVPGATEYGVEIVCTKPDATSNNKKRIWALNTTDSATFCTFDLLDVPPGTYQWLVVAFNKTGVMGKFSKGRTFIVGK